MPIYEFYCHRCNTVYNFLSRSVNTDKVPLCPACGDVELKRKVSLFATIRARGEDSGADDGLPPIDEARMEKALAMLSREAQGLDENDPRQAARLMRRLTDAAGLSMGAGMEEALSRMERGEDPDQIEAEMGDLLESEDPFLAKASSPGQRPRPKVDETLYEL